MTRPPISVFSPSLTYSLSISAWGESAGHLHLDNTVCSSGIVFSPGSSAKVDLLLANLLGPTRVGSPMLSAMAWMLCIPLSRFQRW